jgi:hypothetical protein
MAVKAVVRSEEKWCSKCEKVKAVEEFSRDRSASNGRQGWCKVCKRLATHEWHLATYVPHPRLRNVPHPRFRKVEDWGDPEHVRAYNRARYVSHHVTHPRPPRESDSQRRVHNRTRALTLLGGVCVWPGCNTTEDLHFDHIDPSLKSFQIAHRLASYSWARLLPEIHKCQLLCEKHHVIKTKIERAVREVIFAEARLTLALRHRALAESQVLRVITRDASFLKAA